MLKIQIDLKEENSREYIKIGDLILIEYHVSSCNTLLQLVSNDYTYTGYRLINISAGRQLTIRTTEDNLQEIGIQHTRYVSELLDIVKSFLKRKLTPNNIKSVRYLHQEDFELTLAKKGES